MNFMLCQICEKGKMNYKKVEVFIRKTLIGKFKAHTCKNCNEQIFNSNEAKRIERVSVLL